MRNVFDIQRLPPCIAIGEQTEDGAVQVAIDAAAWLEA